jgi:hypothetical protein
MSTNRQHFPLDCLGLNYDFPALLTKAVIVAVAWFAVAASSGQPISQTVLYRLNSDSSVEQGCFPPCECPIMLSEPVKGTFLLTLTNSNSLFDTYAVTDVSWSTTLDGVPTLVTGGGIYKVGGEFALLQQLSLDLQMNGGNVEHFDSGLVVDSTPFPDINVAISTNHQYCFDTVFNVSASPAPVPQLRVGLAGAQAVTVSWAVSPVTFVLQECPDLATGAWTTVTNLPSVIGQQNQVVLACSSGKKFYRLQPGRN